MYIHVHVHDIVHVHVHVFVESLVEYSQWCSDGILYIIYMYIVYVCTLLSLSNSFFSHSKSR